MEAGTLAGAELPSALPRLCRPLSALIRLLQLHAMGLGAMRVMQAGRRAREDAGKELDLLPRVLASPLPVLDSRARGTRFIQLSVRSVLNTPASTHMGFWSINPYVGCEFGCTYCYARDTHRWMMERAEGRSGGQSDESMTKANFVLTDRPADRLPAWEAFE